MSRGTVHDVPGDGRDEPKKLKDQRYSLNLSINGDWYASETDFEPR